MVRDPLSVDLSSDVTRRSAAMARPVTPLPLALPRGRLSGKKAACRQRSDRKRGFYEKCDCSGSCHARFARVCERRSCRRQTKRLILPREQKLLEQALCQVAAAGQVWCLL